MGNRAIVKPVNKDIGVYLHWNGGIDSVTAFLKYCELKGFRAFDDAYGMARFCQVVGNFFGGSLSIGIETGVIENEDYAVCIDNGIYVVDGWKIVRHIADPHYHEGYDLDDMLHYIDEQQPEKEQLGDFLDAVETDISDIHIGDIVFVMDCRQIYEKWPVVGIGDREWINGHEAMGVPYIDKYYGGPDNVNNYIFEKARVWKGE